MDATTLTTEQSLPLPALAKYIERRHGVTMSPNSLWRWCRVGVASGIKLPYLRLGRRIVVRVGDLDAFMARLRREDETQQLASAAALSKPKRGTTRHARAEAEAAAEGL